MDKLKIFIICNKILEKDRYNHSIEQLKKISKNKIEIEYFSHIWAKDITNDIYNKYSEFFKVLVVLNNTFTYNIQLINDEMKSIDNDKLSTEIVRQIDTIKQDLTTLDGPILLENLSLIEMSNESTRLLSSSQSDTSLTFSPSSSPKPPDYTATKPLSTSGNQKYTIKINVDKLLKNKKFI